MKFKEEKWEGKLARLQHGIKERSQTRKKNFINKILLSNRRREPEKEQGEYKKSEQPKKDQIRRNQGKTKQNKMNTLKYRE